MIVVQDCVDAITAAAGWKKASPDKEGRFHVILEGDLSMDMFSPDGRTVLFLSDLGPLPQDTQSAEALLQKGAAGVVAGSRKRRSILSLEGDRLVLHRAVPMGDLALMPEHAKDFLNDLAWWKGQLQGKTASSPFSFAFSGMSGNVWSMGR